MIDPYGAYNFSLSGKWPFETYTITPLKFNQNKGNNSKFLPITYDAINLYRYSKQANCTFDKIYDLYNIPTFKIENGFYLLDTESQINTNFKLSSYSPQQTTISWTPSNFRLYNTGYVFNYFALYDPLPKNLNLTTTQLDEPLEKCNSYLLYPSKLILKPTSIVKNGNGTYTITTETKLLSSRIFYLSGNSSIHYSNFAENYKNENLPNSNSFVYETIPSGNIIYTLSSFKYIKNQNFIYFTENYNPYIYSKVLDDFFIQNNIKIRPDSVSVSYDTVYFYLLSARRLGEQPIEFNPRKDENFYSSYIMDYNIKNNIEKYPFGETLSIGETIKQINFTDSSIFNLLTSVSSIQWSSSFLGWDATEADLTYYKSYSSSLVSNNTFYNSITSTDGINYSVSLTAFEIVRTINDYRNIQTFQLIQSSIDTTKELEHIDNAIQKVNINLSNGFCEYITYYELDENGNILQSLTGYPNTPLAISYIVDSDKFFNTSANIQYTNNSISSTTNLVKTWTLNQPPHNYTFNATYSCFNGGIFIGDTATLNFYLSSSIIERNKSEFSGFYLTGYDEEGNEIIETITDSYSSFKIKNSIVSDYGFSNLNIDTFASNDVISFKLLYADELFVNELSCFYGPSLNEIYNLNISPYIPIISAKEILITYPEETYGELRFNLISTLSTYNTKLDCKNTIHLLFSEGKSRQIKKLPIEISKVFEGENNIIVSCAAISSTSEPPFKSLEKTYISWSVEPSSLDVTIVPVDYYTFEPILSTQNDQLSTVIFKNNEIHYFNTQTNTILVSGYGDNLVTIKLSSLNFDEIATIKNDPFAFDFFKDNQFILDNSVPFNNQKTTIFDVSGSVLYGNGNFKIPSYVYLYWFWTYNGNTDLSNIPITAYKNNGQIYNRGDILSANEISSLTFKINLDDGDNSFNTNELKLSLISNYKDRVIKGEKTFILNDYPERNIFNTDFTINYYDYVISNYLFGVPYYRIDLIPGFTQNTRFNRFVITRPKSDLNKFVFRANSDVLPTMSFESISWVISSNTGFFAISTYNSYQDFIKTRLTYTVPNNDTTQTNITLSASKATLANWFIPNDVSTTLKIYTLPDSEFTKKVNFLLYPPYTWINNNNGNLTLLNNTNYTLANSPTAYELKQSNSQNFYVSSDTIFNEYEYYYDLNKTFITTLCSISGQIEIPYHNNFFSDVGTTIYLTAFNEFYPKNNGVFYRGLKQNNTIYTGVFPITANTLPFNTTQQNNFLKNPKILPYDKQKITVIPKITSIDLDQNDYISITQTITPNFSTKKVSTYFPNNSTVGTNLYTLSCKYWKTSIEVSPENGFYELFFLRIGDPSIPLNIKDNEITTLKLSVSSNIPVKIPSTTFNNVVLSGYIGDTDLWDTKNEIIIADPITLVAYSTSVEPEVFISSYYTITGKEIALQLQTPENSFNYVITSYDVFFGDGTSQKIYDDQLFYKTYLNDGVYSLSYNVYYNNGTSKFLKLESPIFVYNYWPSYDQSKIRLLNEKILNFGIEEDTYSLDQIEIQPNEWGDSDIFNTALNRIQSNLNYLIYNSQTMNTDSPTLFYGWLGNNIEQKAFGIKWHTLTYNKQYSNSPQNAISLQNESDDIKTLHSYFFNLKDAVETKDRIYVIDDNKFRAFSGGKIPQEIYFENKLEIDSSLINPVSIDVDETGENIYISDSFKNKIFKFNIDFDSYPPQINQQLVIGNLGTREDVNKLNAPSQIFYINDNIFVLDYNNNCIKQYTNDLNWVFTYHTSDFDLENKKPIGFAVNPSNLLIYVLTENYMIYIFDYFKSEIFETIDVLQIKENFDLVKIFFDQSGDFFYILNQKNVYKFSASGSFINQVSIQNPNDQITFTSARYSDYRSIILVSEYGILKFQDILTTFKIGEGLSTKYWTKDQLNLSNDEFADDLTYNRALNRMAQNIKTYRDTLESRFVIVTEQTDVGVVEYFSLYPISHENRPKFSDKIENETLGVGANEFHIPQVFNREIKELFNSLVTLKDFLEIKDLRIANVNANSLDGGCNEIFCWSWKAMSCYNLSLPVIKICNINPITYAELESSFPSDYTYAPKNKNKYGDAISRCCEDFKNPLSN